MIIEVNVYLSLVLTKRCNQSGRSVIGPDPTLKFGEIAVPEAMANILTVPVSVTDFNINELQNLCDNGRIDSVLKNNKNNGATRINIKRYRKGTKLIENDIIKRDGKEITVVTGREPVLPGDVIIRNGQVLDKLLHVNRPYPLEIGSVVERKLQDGDWVLLNRQPTLHKASMLGMQVKVKPHCTIRMNLAVTKPFNKSLVGNRRL
jgi:DNA-directed RNA polymerase beta' subunit